MGSSKTASVLIFLFVFGSLYPQELEAPIESSILQREEVLSSPIQREKYNLSESLPFVAGLFTILLVSGVVLPFILLKKVKKDLGSHKL